MSWNGGPLWALLSDIWISLENNVPRSNESKTLQLNLLLPIDTPPVDLPQERQDELSVALAKLLLSAAGVEVKDDES